MSIYACLKTFNCLCKCYSVNSVFLFYNFFLWMILCGMSFILCNHGIQSKDCIPPWMVYSDKKWKTLNFLLVIIFKLFFCVSNKLKMIFFYKTCMSFKKIYWYLNCMIQISPKLVKISLGLIACHLRLESHAYEQRVDRLLLLKCFNKLRWQLRLWSYKPLRSI